MSAWRVFAHGCFQLVLGGNLLWPTAASAKEGCVELDAEQDEAEGLELHNLLVLGQLDDALGHVLGAHVDALACLGCSHPVGHFNHGHELLANDRVDRVDVGGELCCEVGRRAGLAAVDGGLEVVLGGHGSRGAGHVCQDVVGDGAVARGGRVVWVGGADGIERHVLDGLSRLFGPKLGGEGVSLCRHCVLAGLQAGLLLAHLLGLAAQRAADRDPLDGDQLQPGRRRVEDGDIVSELALGAAVVLLAGRVVEAGVLGRVQQQLGDVAGQRDFAVVVVLVGLEGDVGGKVQARSRRCLHVSCAITAVARQRPYRAPGPAHPCSPPARP